MFMTRSQSNTTGRALPMVSLASVLLLALVFGSLPLVRTDHLRGSSMPAATERYSPAPKHGTAELTNNFFSGGMTGAVCGKILATYGVNFFHHLYGNMNGCQASKDALVRAVARSCVRKAGRGFTPRARCLYDPWVEEMNNSPQKFTDLNKTRSILWRGLIPKYTALAVTAAHRYGALEGTQWGLIVDTMTNLMSVSGGSAAAPILNAAGWDSRMRRVALDAVWGIISDVYVSACKQPTLDEPTILGYSVPLDNTLGGDKSFILAFELPRIIRSAGGGRSVVHLVDYGAQVAKKEIDADKRIENASAYKIAIDRLPDYHSFTVSQIINSLAAHPQDPDETKYSSLATVTFSFVERTETPQTAVFRNSEGFNTTLVFSLIEPPCWISQHVNVTYPMGLQADCRQISDFPKVWFHDVVQRYNTLKVLL